MNRIFSFERTVLGYVISAVLFPAGNDWVVMITGGCMPHTGSISTAYWQSTGVALQEILLPAHRDNVVSRRFAEALCRELHTTVTAVCGIHYDAPGPNGLEQILSCTEALLSDILASFRGSGHSGNSVPSNRSN